jgi:hypothetical protein
MRPGRCDYDLSSSAICSRRMVITCLISSITVVIDRAARQSRLLGHVLWRNLFRLSMDWFKSRTATLA